MSVSCTVVMQAKVIETLTDDSVVDTGGDASITHTLGNLATTIKSDTSVPATKVSSRKLALSTGALTIDMTSLAGANGATITALGLKLQVWKLKNLGAAGMTFSEGASNGYAALGAAFSFILLQNQEAMFYLNDAAPDVASGDRTIDVAGTGSQEFQNTMVFG